MALSLGRLLFSEDGKELHVIEGENEAVHSAESEFIGDGRQIQEERKNFLERTRLKIALGESILGSIKSANKKEATVILEYGDRSKLVVKQVSHDDNIDRFDFTWTAPEGSHYMKDTAYLGFRHVYGGPELSAQKWPLDPNSHTFAPYVTTDVYWVRSMVKRNENMTTLCKIIVDFRPTKWMAWSATGWSPRRWLFTSLEEFRFGRSCGKIVFRFKRNSEILHILRSRHYQLHEVSFQDPTTLPVLEYSIYTLKPGKTSTLWDFHLSISRSLFVRPSSLPDERILREPIWTTWVKYGKGITQKQVMEYAQEITSRNFPISQLELDDKWSTEWGDFQFDPTRFPDVPAMIKALNELGVRLTAWVHPFFTPQCRAYQDPSLKYLFVTDVAGKPLQTKWWNDDTSYILDPTRTEAADWFVAQLQKLQEMGVFSFKFDAGETNFLPTGFRLHKGTTPLDYSTAYLRMAARLGTAIEIRTGSGTQDIPAVVRTLDRDSTWTGDLSLTTLIPTVLNFSINGYFFNLPDIIGGNAGSKLTSELFFRWTQVNLFFVAMQFSNLPWQYGEELTEKVRSLLGLRKTFADYLVREAQKAVETGVPVIRPLWSASESAEALIAGDSFMVGDRLLVIPVLEEKAKKRRIFLPKGRWNFQADPKRLYIGPLVEEIRLAADDFIFFTREKEGDESNVLESVDEQKDAESALRQRQEKEEQQAQLRCSIL